MMPVPCGKRRRPRRGLISMPGLPALALRRVLIVEDDTFLADEMARALRKLGADVVGPAPTLDKALTLLEAEPVDVAVLDINLQRERAFPVAAALRAQGVPFVFTTGYGQGTIPPE